MPSTLIPVPKSGVKDDCRRGLRQSRKSLISKITPAIDVAVPRGLAERLCAAPSLGFDRHMTVQLTLVTSK